MKYGLFDRPPFGVTFLAAMQWLIVTLSSSIAVPLVIGNVYGLSPDEIGTFMQQTIFFMGAASFLQVWIGHRYPMMDGPAGLWWGIFVILGQIGISIGIEPRTIGQSFQGGLLLSGALFFILGMTKWIGRIQQWFTPVVSGTYMVLLAISLSSTFIKGMLGIGFHNSNVVQPGIAVASLVIMALVLLFTKLKYTSSFAVLAGMVVGWCGYALLGWTDPVKTAGQMFLLPRLFFWGPIHWDAGVIVTCILTSFVLLTNLITSMAVLEKAVKEQASEDNYNRAGIFTGVSHLLAGLSGVVGMIPLSLAAAVIQTTKIAARLPFIIAMIAIMAIGMIPAVSLFFAAMPTPVAYAAMFVAYTQLLGFGLKDFSRVKLDERNVTIIGSSLLVGIGVMFIPAEAWKSVHPLLSFLLGNGLLLGVLVCLLFERFLFANKTQNESDGPSR